MNHKPRFILDTNVIVSAVLLRNSVAHQAFLKAYQNGVLLFSWPIAEELSEVLQRAKFDRYVSLDNRMAFLATLTARVVFVEITETVTVCRDPKDNKFLELAIAGQATCLISGDKDLLVLDPFRGIPILRPDQFLINY